MSWGRGSECRGVREAGVAGHREEQRASPPMPGEMLFASVCIITGKKKQEVFILLMYFI